jgi:hypothetical protein
MPALVSFFEGIFSEMKISSQKWDRACAIKQAANEELALAA